MAKLSKENIASAKKIFKSDATLKTLYINNKGEFFTSENLANNSVAEPKKNVQTISRDTIDETETSEEGTGEPAK
ncbi:hypothetical protein NTJ28_001675 [Flavobacterium psychrophilum]|nr:hypothetical protein [Flavobacterium psychrophilum]EKT4510348.1 hypothetical protein [Flavobacterium psychrophilum]